jgi:hypothetical protein
MKKYMTRASGKMNSKLIRANFRGYFKRFITAIAGANNTFLDPCSGLSPVTKGLIGYLALVTLAAVPSARYYASYLRKVKGIRTLSFLLPAVRLSSGQGIFYEHHSPLLLMV